MNALIWRLPRLIHEIILEVTGWQLVEGYSGGRLSRYHWKKATTNTRTDTDGDATP